MNSFHKVYYFSKIHQPFQVASNFSNKEKQHKNHNWDLHRQLGTLPAKIKCILQKGSWKNLIRACSQKEWDLLSVITAKNDSKERIISASNCINGRLLWKPFKEMHGLEWYNDAAAEGKKKSVQC